MTTPKPFAPPATQEVIDGVAAQAFADAAMQTEQAQAAQEAKAKADAEEAADVAAWEKRITDAREFDKPARKQYAIDRSYCGGEAGRAGFDVTVNIAGTYTDILVAFLYAQDPAADVVPEESVGPARLEMARLLSKTLAIVIKKTWAKAQLKAAARPMVRSGVSVGIGWLKAAFHQRTGADPITATKIADLQDNLRRLAASQAELAAGTSDNPDALRASIQAQIAGLQGGMEVVLSRGMVIDFVAAEDVQVAPECGRLEDYRNSPWIAHRAFLPATDAASRYNRLTADEHKAARVYTQVKPQDEAKRAEAGAIANVTDTSADAYTTGGAAGSMADASAGAQHVCIWEIQSKDDGVVYTWIEGTKRWALQPAPPMVATTRFYTLFQWAPIQVDGRRHAQSLTSRGASMIDEYNRIRTGLRDHRSAAKPKLGFNRRAVSKEDAERMEGGATGEMIGLDVIGEDPKSVLFPIEYNRIDPALYDTSAPRQELEMLYGIQEALTSTIRTAKTLGEAEIQQSGTQAREGHKRESLEDMLTDLASYTAEIGLQVFTVEDVQAMAGPEAFWPATPDQKLTVDDLATLVSVEIRAGSSGKPNTRLRQEQWATTMPVLREAIEHMAALQQSNPLDTARCIGELVKETLDRMGERIDPMRFLPQPGQPVMLTDPATGMPVLAYLAPPEMQPKPPAAAPGGGGAPPMDPAAPPGAPAPPAEPPPPGAPQ